jgi:sigma-B regulation protein RsbU (phosphoserine phosphatase)
VYTAPAGPGDAGGDVHYVSVCPSCIVSRIALADVSGHGEGVVTLGNTLRALMQRHLEAVEQVGLMRDLNQAVQEGLDGVHYATMVAVGWHNRRGLLVLTNAGHPPPLWYHRASHEWTWLETQRAREQTRPTGLPLGLLPDIAYDRKVVRPAVDDLIVLYSDGVSEMTNPAGEELGREGLINSVRELTVTTAEAVGMQLTSTLDRFRGNADSLDDVTIIVVERVAGNG